MCAAFHNTEKRKLPLVRGPVIRREYGNVISKITLSVWIAEEGLVRVAYFPGAVAEDEPSYAVSPEYVAPGAEIREYDEPGICQ